VANDVTIVVEASLGDTLLKLELAKLAVEDLDHAGTMAGHNLGDETNHNSFAYRLGRLRYALGNIGDRGPIGSIVRGFGNLASAMLAPIQAGADFAKNFEQAGTVGQALIATISSLGIGLVALAAAAMVVVFAAEALASILGTLVAIVADLVAPVTLLVGLLGGLGVGFAIAAKRAAEGGIHLKGFSGIVDTLGSMFHRTSTLLAQRFLPYLIELGHAAETALLFLDKVIKLPLGQAFRMIDTQGTKLLGQFVDRVAEVLSKPIRLAFHVAFEDSSFHVMVADWWHRFVGFLFGETDRHPVEIRPGVFKILPRTVDGVLQPFIDWWNRHHFTKQGIQIGQQILRGIMNSGMRGRIIDFFVQIFKDAGRRAFNAVRASAFSWVKWWGHEIADVARGFVQKISSAAGTARDWLKTRIGEAWDWVKRKVGTIWDEIVKIVEAPFDISINWPSPPGWFTSLLSGAGGLVSDIGHGVSGMVPGGHVATANRAAPRAGAMASPNVFVTIHGADLSDATTQRRVAAQVGRAVIADWRKRAGGH